VQNAPGVAPQLPPTDMPHRLPSVPTRLLGLANGIALAAYIISLLYSSTRRLSYSTPFSRVDLRHSLVAQ
jgi:hypothetical protein